MAMMLNTSLENDAYIINKYEEVEAFLSSLVTQLHRQKMWATGSSNNGIVNLEQELRFLLTFVRDTAFIGCHEHQEFQKLLPEVKAVGNEVKSLLVQQTDEGLAAVLNHFELITPKISDFLTLLPAIRRSVCTTPKFSALDSLPIVDSLRRDLEEIIEGEDNQVYDAMDQIEVLCKRLKQFQSSIKGIECVQHSVITKLKQPLLQIGHMAHEAEYLLVSFSVGVAPLWYLHNRLTHINHEIQLIGTKLQQMTEMYKSEEVQVEKYNSESPPSLPATSKINITVDQVTVGFEDKTVEVLDLLIGGAESLKVISIIGMAGLGKTTLARKLYNSSLVNYKFDKLSWCVVSQTYLIVMDDVWDSDVWDNFQGCFPDDGSGSRMLFTSRNKGVAPSNSIVYAMPSLSNDQCWELLQKKVFEDNGCPPQLLEIGKKIAANCRGLPLAVVVIAGILSTMDRKKTTWEQVGGNLASNILNGGYHSVRQILELSYKHLPLHLKPCFLYLATFKEDEEINARKLMRLWIAEGFIYSGKENHAEDMAEEYLMELIDKSLVMVTKRRSDGGVKTCSVHDLLRDFCLKGCRDENFIKFGEKGSRLRVVGGPISRRYCQHVSSIHGQISLPYDLDVCDLRLLRLVNYDCCLLVPRITHIEYLVTLKYLIIEIYSPTISLILEKISGLVKLEHLFVKTKEMVSLPPTIVRMRKLRFLQVVKSGARYNQDWNSSHTTNLEFLSYLVIGDRKDEETLRCSPPQTEMRVSTITERKGGVSAF